MNPELLIAVGLIAIMFGAPALVEPVRRTLARRAQARAERDADRARVKQQAAAAHQRAERVWREFPAVAGMAEYLRYMALVQLRLHQAMGEARTVLNLQKGRARNRQLELRGGKGVTSSYRVLVLTGLGFFVVVSTLGIALDYLIFRGLHPTGTRLLPLGLACLAVVGIMVGSVIFLGATRHHLLPPSATPYMQRVVMLGGAMLACGIALYMTMIAPYRSYPIGQANITHAAQVLSADTYGVPPAPPLVIAQDKQAVIQAKTDLAQAQHVDRLSAVALAALEIPLSEAAILGSELLMLDQAVRRRQRAQRAVRDANDALERANTRFVAELTQILISHGHMNVEQLVPDIIARVTGFTTPADGPSAIHAFPVTPVPDPRAGPQAAGTANPPDSVSKGLRPAINRRIT